MSGQEFVDWIAYFSLEPFGHARLDVHFARLMALLANINRQKDARPFEPRDFMPEFGSAEDAQRRQDEALLEKLEQAFR